MPSTETSRNLSVFGDVGATFMLFILESGTLKYYDFESKSFELGHNDKNNNLIETLTTGSYTTSITFPAGGATYVIKVLPGVDTEINGGVITKSITQVASTPTVTFKPKTANTSNYSTFPTSTSSGSVGDSAQFTFDWDVTNVSNDSHGFGLKSAYLFASDFGGPDTSLPRALAGDSWWFTQTTATTVGAVTASRTIIVDDLTGIGLGSTITAGTGLSGTPSITGINKDEKQITLSTIQTISSGVTLTFQARGAKQMHYAHDADFSFGGPLLLEAAKVTKTIRAGSSGQDINLNGTYGIAGGNTVTLFGLGIDNSSANAVTSVTASSSAGSVEVQNSQSDLTTNSTITFLGCYQVISITGEITVDRYPTSNLEVYLDIDKIITVGAAS
jgi:hypothetical protein